MIKQAVILAGGKGTRLASRLKGIPKSLADFGGETLIHRQIDELKQYGCESLIILCGHESQALRDYFAKKNNFSMEVVFIQDGQYPGTGVALLNAYKYLQNEFLVVYGDTVFNIDLHRFYISHRKSEADVTIFCHPNDHPDDSDLLEVSPDSRIIKIHGYPHPAGKQLRNLVNAALYIVRRECLDEFAFSSEYVDIGKHLFPKLIECGYYLSAYQSSEYIKDCGTPHRIDQALSDFRSGLVEKSNLRNKQKIIFTDRDGTLNKEINHLAKVEDLILYPGVPQAIGLINKSEYKVCIVTNQPVIARGGLTENGLREVHNKLESEIGKFGAYLDRIYYCPHHPDSGFANEIAALKIKCDCRKPNVGMFEKAKIDFNADLANSWMIGDSTADILAANRFGIRSILLRTGYGGNDEKWNAEPDFTLDNFKDAIDFIIKKYPKIYRYFQIFMRKSLNGRVICIGGQSRSGKSSLANIIKYVLLDQGKRVNIVKTDNWIIGEGNRGSGVYGRHNVRDLKNYLNEIKSIEKLTTIKRPYYKKRTRESILNAGSIEHHPEEVLIIEGVISLKMAEIFENPIKLFVDCVEVDRKQRFLNEYSSRGFGAREAESLYTERLGDEYHLVESFRADSSVINVNEMLDDN